jgi:hypothetical protein
VKSNNTDINKFEWHNIVIPIIVGLIGVIGTLGGIYLGNIINAKQIQEQRKFDFINKTYFERIKILDNTCRIFGKSPGVQDIWIKYLKNQPNAPLSVVEKLTEYQGEYESSVMMSTIYFGPKTKAAAYAICNVNTPWWNKPKPLQDSLIVAMTKELTYGFDDFRNN